MLKGEKVILRIVRPSDATLLFLWEKKFENTRITKSQSSISLFFIRELIESQMDVFSNHQLRFIICLKEKKNTPIGTLDLYDVNFDKLESKIGVLIADNNYRNKGYADESLKLLANYCKKELSILNLFSTIHTDNIASINLFEKNGFKEIKKINNEKTYFLCLKKD